MTSFIRSTIILGGLLSTFTLFSSSAEAIIRHPDGYEPSTGSPNGPANWFARYSSSASGIIVGPNQILTTRHQLGSNGTSIVVPSGPNAGSYTQLTETTFGTDVDLRLVTVNANFTTWASLYTGNPSGQTAVVGGFGPGRNNIAVTSGTQLRGYGWGPAAGNSYNLTFGQQYINGVGTFSDSYTATSSLNADFDAPENVTPTYTGVLQPPIGPVNKVLYEAGVTDGDSGGGWFIDVGGTYQLVGLTHGAALQRMDSNGTLSQYFGGNGDPVMVFGSAITAVNVSSYASQINAVLPEPTSLGLLAIGGFAMLRRSRNR